MDSPEKIESDQGEAERRIASSKNSENQNTNGQPDARLSLIASTSLPVWPSTGSFAVSQQDVGQATTGLHQS
jgi:hypothetical protein